MIDASFGFVHDKCTPRSRAEAASPAGFAGGGTGVAATSFDSAPVPEEFRARILNACSVPFVNPVTVWLVVAAPLFAIAVHSP